MTVIKPNSVAGINSITVQSGNSLAVHKANGELIRTITSNSGVSTFSTLSVGTATTDNSAAKSINIGLGASISQHNDNALTFGTNGDPRITIDAAGDFNVGTAATIKANGNATFSGIVTAASFVGDGSGLTNAGPSLTGSTNNTIVTVTGANAIAGESNLTFDGSNTLAITGPQGGAARIDLIADEGDDAGDKWRIANTSGNDFKIQRTTSHTDSLTIDSSGNSQFAGQVKVSSSNASTVAFSVGDTNTGFYNAGSNIFGYSIGGTEKLRIDSNGRVLIGHTASLSESTRFQVVDTSDNTAEFFAYASSTSGARLTLTKSRSGTKGTNTVVQSGDKLGEIHFRGADGTGYIRGATISAEVDGTPGTNDMPGRLVFSTTADGANSQTERLRIDSSGNVTVGSGNLVIGTSGKGIDFSATSSAAGSTSELFDDYEEGTWTGTMATGTATITNERYVKVGNLVHVGFYANGFSDTTSSSQIVFNGLPYTSQSNHISTGQMLLAYITHNGQTVAYIGGSDAAIYLYHYSSGGDYSALQHSAIASSSSTNRVFLSMTYEAV